MQLVVTVLSFKTQGKGIHWLSALKLHEEKLAGLTFKVLITLGISGTKPPYWHTELSVLELLGEEMITVGASGGWSWSARLDNNM